MAQHYAGSEIRTWKLNAYKLVRDFKTPQGGNCTPNLLFPSNSAGAGYRLVHGHVCLQALMAPLRMCKLAVGRSVCCSVPLKLSFVCCLSSTANVQTLIACYNNFVILQCRHTYYKQCQNNWEHQQTFNTGVVCQIAKIHQASASNQHVSCCWEYPVALLPTSCKKKVREGSGR